ncbi:hypothetical protein A2477_00745 [Candidatus Falkowbacteria bacterium RIFOXYC2_FULL_47_12]|uniref:Type II secretion system protein GspG C-terminal domain-containing protein n=2 Tax=Candidatus Falkowiibacteriota TaxID=1752728 RepID=A0A1F5TPK8_9BACT|nr:MAG: hypothetical protein A2242_04665 [Candidatus Falkowbacteria bacterium RIFOXYA2_FULL_47_9]OGF40724.1 MAG: hypothetical protein A2477_00745 [Candidatus Falkowbacteria bacterium RIFOXYC2_FULL_47_12]
MNKSIIVKITFAVIAIVCVSALLLLLVNYAQKKQRDVIRLNDISGVRFALEAYFFNRQQYPIVLTPVVLGSAGARVLCDTAAGLEDADDDCEKIFLAPLPHDPLAESGAHYFYASNGRDYALTFSLERSDSGLAAGEHEASAEGIK